MWILKSTLIAAGAMLVISPSALLAQAPTATTTTLSMSSKGDPVSDAGSIPSPSALTLTAAVTAGGATVTSGQVNFCDATAAHCTDIHLLGTAQIIQSGPNLGKAILTYVPGIGSHSYKAVFLGTPNGVANNSASTSNTASLQVSGVFPTSISINVEPGPSPYTIDSTIYGSGNRPDQALTGTVTIVDRNNNNATVASASPAPGDSMASVTNQVNGYGVTTPFNATAMVTADVNGDGLPDAVIGGTTDGTTGLVQAYLSNGIAPSSQGYWFSPVATTLPLQNYPNAIVTGDFNGDGIVDLAVTTTGSNAIQILLGAGAGRFTPGPGPLNYSQQLGAMVVGDFNHDGYADLAIISANLVLVFKGKGDGSFTAPVTTDTTTPNPRYIVAGDFNNDGFPDLVVEDGFTEDAYYLANSGDGTFVPTRIEQGGNTPSGPLAVADFDGDGNLDVVIGYFFVMYHTTGNIYYGNGDGSFPAVSPPFEGGFPPPNPQFVVGDFNGDGLPDIVEAAANYGGNPIYFNSGGRTFISPFATHKGVGAKASGLSIPGSFLSVADVNGDGVADIIQILAPGPLVVETSQFTIRSTTKTTGVGVVGSGVHLLEGNYSGDFLFGASTTTQGALVTAQPGTPAVSLSLPGPSIGMAQALVVTVSVSDGSANPIPTGTVTLTSGTYSSGAVKLTGGSTAITIPSGKLAVGTATLTATYSGDTNYLTATGSASISVTAKSAPQASLSLSASTIPVSQALTVTATLAGPTGQPSPTGTVTLTSGTYSSPAVTLAGGSAVISIPAGSLPVGADTLTVAYSGDSLYFAATATAQLTVTNPTFAISGTAVTVTAGATTGNTSTITVSPSGGFLGNVTLTAAIASSPTGAIHPPTFSFGSTSPVAISGAANGSATLTIATTATQTPSCNTNAATPPKSPWFTGGGVVLACLMLFGIPARRIALRRIASALLLFAWIGMASACGGGGARQACPQAIMPGTSSGTYTITVTGTSGSYSSSGNVTLTVQ